MTGSRLAVTALVVSAVAGLAACGDDGNPAVGSSAASRSTPGTTPGTTPGNSPQGDSRPLIIKTHVIGFEGQVLGGSLIGGSPFCPGGTVHHAFGSPTIGYPAINVFRCGKSQLKIGFGPGPDQMNQRIQTSDWKVLSGAGDYFGATGFGHMKVVFPAAGSPNGRETFEGTIVLP